MEVKISLEVSKAATFNTSLTCTIKLVHLAALFDMVRLALELITMLQSSS